MAVPATSEASKIHAEQLMGAGGAGVIEEEIVYPQIATAPRGSTRSHSTW